MFWLVVCPLLFVLVSMYSFRRKGDEFFDLIPGPTGKFIIANMLNFKMSQADVFCKGRELALQFNGLYKLKILWLRIVTIYTPGDVEVILTNAPFSEKGLMYSFMRPWLNEGLLINSGKTWHKNRKILTPAFHFKVLQHFCEIINENSSRLVDQLQEETRKEKTDIIPILTECALHSICETAMGTSLTDDKSVAAENYKLAVIQIIKLLVNRVIRLWLHPAFIFNRTAAGRQQQKVLNDLHLFTNGVIEERRQSRKDDGSYTTFDENSDVFTNSKRRLAMLDLLLCAESEGKINEQGIRDEVDTFMFAGHDTTTVAMVYVLMNLANHREIQDKVYEEVVQVMDNDDKASTQSDYANMKYLDCCIKESLRLYPSVPLIARIMTEDVRLNGYKIPAGTEVTINFFELHRRADSFQDPLIYRPERFLPEAPPMHPFAFLPFSAGPRNCIGRRFAMLTLKSVVAAIVKNYILEPVTKPEDIVFNQDLVLRSRDPIYVKFTPRNKAQTIKQ